MKQIKLIFILFLFGNILLMLSACSKKDDDIQQLLMTLIESQNSNNGEGNSNGDGNGNEGGDNGGDNANNGSGSLKSCPDSNHPHMIDLGLPSGTKWACCNVGATKPEEYGNYYAWGETQPKSMYNWDTYRWANGGYDNLTKYNTNSNFGTVDGKTALDASDDAATANWGTPWCMPSYEQIEELHQKATCTWTTKNGVYGEKFTGSNGGMVFLPAAGYRWSRDLDYASSDGFYWSSTLIVYTTTYYAYGLRISSGSSYWGSFFDRYYGQSVRPVCQN